MGTWNRAKYIADCRADCSPGRCQGHQVSVSLQRSTDSTTLAVDGHTIVMADSLADALFELWREMRDE